ncbi:hypothetical protein PDJAM_G00178430, partial [Pangasius djambal]|nr:hypothetical protein [Pangasius djambal]
MSGQLIGNSFDKVSHSFVVVLGRRVDTVEDLCRRFTDIFMNKIRINPMFTLANDKSVVSLVVCLMCVYVKHY